MGSAGMRMHATTEGRGRPLFVPGTLHRSDLCESTYKYSCHLLSYALKKGRRLSAYNIIQNVTRQFHPSYCEYEEGKEGDVCRWDCRAMARSA